ncbi:MAG TPA: YdcF family protein [Stellaceae bacterium]|nr:YdcF family protein [Stellaceae bacterium]
MRGRRLPRAVRWGAPLLAAIAALWLGGLIRFIGMVPSAVVDQDSTTDAIVVLTGGSLRVENGIQLLSAGKARKLFVSGVYHGVDVGDLLRASSQQPERVQCCIVLGHAAESTAGNALETAAFMREQDFHSLRLVTASYHMPRSLLEFSRAMPGIAIVPNPVFPEIVRDERWWLRPAGLSLAIGEYSKYLVALTRLELAGAP